MTFFLSFSLKHFRSNLQYFLKAEDWILIINSTTSCCKFFFYPKNLKYSYYNFLSIHWEKYFKLCQVTNFVCYQQCGLKYSVRKKRNEFALKSDIIGFVKPKIWTVLEHLWRCISHRLNKYIQEGFGFRITVHSLAPIDQGRPKYWAKFVLVLDKEVRFQLKVKIVEHL